MSCVTVNNSVAQRVSAPVRKLENPFFVAFSDAQRRAGTLSEGISASVSIRSESILSAWLLSLWGVDVNPFYSTLNKDWDSMRRELMDGSFLAPHIFMRNDPVMITDINKVQELVIKSPKEMTSEMLGPVPRGKFPLVVVLIANGDSLEESRAVAHLTILHLKDSICTGESSVVSQFLKQADGRVINIQQLFVAQSDPISDGTESSGTCVICLDERANVALLPCRHTCLCDECLTKVEFCPMCRIHFTSHFKIPQI